MVKKGINININIQKKDLFLISAIAVFLVGMTYVIATGSGDSTIHGHDQGELEGVIANLSDLQTQINLKQNAIINSCGADQSIKIINSDGSVVCEDDDQGGRVIGGYVFMDGIGCSTLYTWGTGYAPSQYSCGCNSGTPTKIYRFSELELWACIN